MQRIPFATLVAETTISPDAWRARQVRVAVTPRSAPSSPALRLARDGRRRRAARAIVEPRPEPCTELYPAFAHFL